MGLGLDSPAPQSLISDPLLSLTPRLLRPWLQQRGYPPYRAGQVLTWVYQRRVPSFDAMSDLPRTLREELAQTFTLPHLKPTLVSRSHDGTRKLLFELSGAAAIEAVLIPDEPRLTLCISSQAGCGMGCAFCATARLGLIRNLSASEIVGQVLAAHAELSANERVTNIVFMGMGEPLANYDNLLQAIEMLTAAWGCEMSGRRITVSTVGLVPQMQRLVSETDVHLAVSLTGTTDAQRDALMPINRRYPLADLLGMCRQLPLRQRRRITFEYVLLAGVNDTPQDASRLARLLHGIRAKVNLIPFNPFPDAGFARSNDDAVLRFQKVLLAAEVSTSIRRSRGRDIQAACGQLALANQAASL